MWNRRTHSLDFFFSFLNRCILSRETVGVNLISIFLLLISQYKTLFSESIIVAMNSTFTSYHSCPALKIILGPGLENNFKIIFLYSKKIILEFWRAGTRASSVCLLSLFGLWAFLFNKSEKNVLVTVVLDSAFLKLCSKWAVSLVNYNFPALCHLSPCAFPDLKCQSIKQMELHLEHWFGGGMTPCF